MDDTNTGYVIRLLLAILRINWICDFAPADSRSTRALLRKTRQTGVALARTGLRLRLQRIQRVENAGNDVLLPNE